MQRPDLEQALTRLLGSPQAEVGCDECFEMVDRYVELELADADAEIPRFQAHLAGCQVCREDYESLRAFVGGQQIR